jgi:hypothetical protein
MSPPGAGRAGRALLLAVLVAWTISIWRDGDIRAGVVGSGFLHMALLPFHEAGHVILRLLGNFMMILGGSLGQLLMPIAAGYALLRRRDAFGAALCLWLLGFSVVDMAVYMYDAFDPKLVLLGGATGAESDRHDWQNLFGDTGLLRHARGIGLFFGFVGYLAMLAGLAWAAIALWLRPEPEDESPYSGPA